EPTSLSRDDRYREAFPIVSSLDAGQDRENIAKTSSMSHESSPRVPSFDADKGSMQQRLHELMELCTSLQRQQSQMVDKIKDQDIEISGLKARVKSLEDKERRRLNRSNEIIAKHLSEYEQAKADLSIGEKIELISPGSWVMIVGCGEVVGVGLQETWVIEMDEGVVGKAVIELAGKAVHSLDMSMVVSCVVGTLVMSMVISCVVGALVMSMVISCVVGTLDMSMVVSCIVGIHMRELVVKYKAEKVCHDTMVKMPLVDLKVLEERHLLRRPMSFGACRDERVVGIIVRVARKGEVKPRRVRDICRTIQADIREKMLRLLEELSSVHDTFHVSNLKKYLADANLHVPLDEIKVNKTLRFIEELVEIMDREIKKLKHRKIVIVKVRWNVKRGPEFT
nr:putative reverse transcriptase domain-containing protein [Tanacetum cinerariifolium]